MSMKNSGKSFKVKNITLNFWIISDKKCKKWKLYFQVDFILN